MEKITKSVLVGILQDVIDQAENNMDYYAGYNRKNLEQDIEQYLEEDLKIKVKL